MRRFEPIIDPAAVNLLEAQPPLPLIAFPPSPKAVSDVYVDDSATMVYMPGGLVATTPVPMNLPGSRPRLMFAPHSDWLLYKRYKSTQARHTLKRAMEANHRFRVLSPARWNYAKIQFIQLLADTKTLEANLRRELQADEKLVAITGRVIMPGMLEENIKDSAYLREFLFQPTLVAPLDDFRLVGKRTTLTTLYNYTHELIRTAADLRYVYEGLQLCIRYFAWNAHTRSMTLRKFRKLFWLETKTEVSFIFRGMQTLFPANAFRDTASQHVANEHNRTNARDRKVIEISSRGLRDLLSTGVEQVINGDYKTQSSGETDWNYLGSTVDNADIDTYENRKLLIFLGLVTGARKIELLRLGRFRDEGGGRFAQTSFAKERRLQPVPTMTRPPPIDPHPIKTVERQLLTHVGGVDVKALDILGPVPHGAIARLQGRVAYHYEGVTNERLGWKFADGAGLSAAVRAILKQIIIPDERKTLDERENDEKLLTFHTLRAVYSAAVYHFTRDNSTEITFIGRILGHEDTDIATSARYNYVRIVDDEDQGPQDGPGEDGPDDGGEDDGVDEAAQTIRELAELKAAVLPSVIQAVETDSDDELATESPAARETRLRPLAEAVIGRIEKLVVRRFRRERGDPKDFMPEMKKWFPVGPMIVPPRSSLNVERDRLASQVTTRSERKRLNELNRAIAERDATFWQVTAPAQYRDWVRANRRRWRTMYRLARRYLLPEGLEEVLRASFLEAAEPDVLGESKTERQARLGVLANEAFNLAITDALAEQDQLLAHWYPDPAEPPDDDAKNEVDDSVTATNFPPPPSGLNPETYRSWVLENRARWRRFYDEARERLPPVEVEAAEPEEEEEKKEEAAEPESEDEELWYKEDAETKETREELQELEDKRDRLYRTLERRTTRAATKRKHIATLERMSEAIGAVKRRKAILGAFDRRVTAPSFDDFMLANINEFVPPPRPRRRQ